MSVWTVTAKRKELIREFLLRVLANIISSCYYVFILLIYRSAPTLATCFGNSKNVLKLETLLYPCVSVVVEIMNTALLYFIYTRAFKSSSFWETWRKFILTPGHAWFLICVAAHICQDLLLANMTLNFSPS